MPALPAPITWYVHTGRNHSLNTDEHPLLYSVACFLLRMGKSWLSGYTYYLTVKTQNATIPFRKVSLNY